MRLAASLCEPGGASNEDAIGWIGEPDDIRAAWVLDGVTGTNARNELGAPTDAAWFVSCIGARLAALMDRGHGGGEILARLIEGLMADETEALAGRQLPPDYETPAACIAAIHRTGGAWHGFRLGDCRLMALGDGTGLTVLKETGLDALEERLKEKASALRDGGIADPVELRRKLLPDQRHLRSHRNRPGGYGVVVADPVCLGYAETLELGAPRSVLLASDGLYRAVDHYGMHDDMSLVRTAAAGLDDIYRALRRVEEADAACLRYPRLKKSDDASAIALSS